MKRLTTYKSLRTFSFKPHNTILFYALGFSLCMNCFENLPCRIAVDATSPITTIIVIEKWPMAATVLLPNLYFPRQRNRKRRAKQQSEFKDIQIVESPPLGSHRSPQLSKHIVFDGHDQRSPEGPPNPSNNGTGAR